MDWIWTKGRFGWPFVSAAVFATISLVCVDLAWRLLTLQFETLLISALLVDAAAAFLLIVLYQAVRRQFHKPPRL